MLLALREGVSASLLRRRDVDVLLGRNNVGQSKPLIIAPASRPIGLPDNIWCAKEIVSLLMLIATSSSGMCL